MSGKPDHGWCAIAGCWNALDGWLDGVALCFDHLDELLERMEAVTIAPAMRELLPPIEEA